MAIVELDFANCRSLAINMQHFIDHRLELELCKCCVNVETDNCCSQLRLQDGIDNPCSPLTTIIVQQIISRHLVSGDIVVDLRRRQQQRRASGASQTRQSSKLTVRQLCKHDAFLHSSHASHFLIGQKRKRRLAFIHEHRQFQIQRLSAQV